MQKNAQKPIVLSNEPLSFENKQKHRLRCKGVEWVLVSSKL